MKTRVENDDKACQLWCDAILDWNFKVCGPIYGTHKTIPIYVCVCVCEASKRHQGVTTTTRTLPYIMHCVPTYCSSRACRRTVNWRATTPSYTAIARPGRPRFCTHEHHHSLDRHAPTSNHNCFVDGSNSGSNGGSAPAAVSRSLATAEFYCKALFDLYSLIRGVLDGYLRRRLQMS